MNEVMTLPSSPVASVRKCQLEDVFDASFIELLALVPRNPHVRALILKVTGLMPALECETFEQLKEWVETHCEMKPKPRPARISAGSQNDGIEITVEFSDTEYGSADYTVPRSGSGEFRIGARNLLDIIQTAIGEGGGLDQIVLDIAGRIDDDAWSQCDPSMNDSGDYEYNQHEASDSGDTKTDYSRNDIRNAVLDFVRERHPELAAEL